MPTGYAALTFNAQMAPFDKPAVGQVLALGPSLEGQIMYVLDPDEAPGSPDETVVFMSHDIARR